MSLSPLLPSAPDRVTVVEVGPRDGLQNEPEVLTTEDKIGFVNRLSAAGLPVIEVTAFVSPRLVPQMADGGDVLRGITRRPGTRYTALVPNRKGLDRALDAGVDEIAIVAAASETFSQRNINQSIEASLAMYQEVCRAAVSNGLRVRGYVSTCFGCPFEGRVPPERVAELAARLADIGVAEVVLSDTIGVGHPAQVVELVTLASQRAPTSMLALHFHDTRGTALANVLAGLGVGVRTFDASAGGLGGCPFAPGATGNLATEDLMYLLNGLDLTTDVSLPDVMDASLFVEALLGRPLPSRYLRAERQTRLNAS